MVAILGGLGAAVAWATSALCASRASRWLGAPSVVAWMAIVGLLITGPWAVGEGVPVHLDGGALGWLVLAGVGNVVGLVVIYLAYRRGDISLISPIASTQGAVAALIAFAGGERVGLASALVLVAIAIGISLAASTPRPAATPQPVATVYEHRKEGWHSREAVLLAGLASVCFGFSLYATGHVSARLPLAWVVLPPRLIGVAALALPLALSGGLRLTARAAPLVIAVGLCEVLGFVSYALGARHDVAVAAILSCQFAVITVVAAYVLFRERLTRPQLAGVVVVVAGVSALSGLRA